MAMNRAQRRYLQKQGQLDSEGNPVATAREPRQVPKGERTTPREYVAEVNSELRRVNWPTRPEVVSYTIVVLVTLLLMTGMIAGLDLLFGEGVLQLLRLGS